MDTLEQLIAKFDREYPDDMRLAREALQANPLKASDLIGIDITDALLCHEINRLRAELAECKRDNERLHVAMCQSCVCLNNGETYRGHQIIRAALAKEE